MLKQDYNRSVHGCLSSRDCGLGPLALARKELGFIGEIWEKASTIGEFEQPKTITTSNNVSAKIQSSGDWQLHSPIIPTARSGQNS
jgi:hypothetical protein